MKNKLCLIFALILPLVANSCTTFVISDMQMGIDSTNKNYQILGDFRVKVPVYKFLGQAGGATMFNLLANNTDTAINIAIQNEIIKRGGTGAINVSIDYGAKFADLLWNYLSLNISASATATITGTVIKDK